mmetsp:Transcript_62271/g.91280  ORF Transcript_62271/g.91280 Transcript_62271/m.91280 type:complete len:95 (-) Transcript_62271:1114-1398(-)
MVSAKHGNVLQYTANYCNALPRIATLGFLIVVIQVSNALQHTALHCTTLQSSDMTGGSPSTSVTVYTKRVQRRLDGGITVNVCGRIHEECAYEV